MPDSTHVFPFYVQRLAWTRRFFRMRTSSPPSRTHAHLPNPSLLLASASPPSVPAGNFALLWNRPATLRHPWTLPSLRPRGFIHRVDRFFFLWMLRRRIDHIAAGASVDLHHRRCSRRAALDIIADDPARPPLPRRRRRRPSSALAARLHMAMYNLNWPPVRRNRRRRADGGAAAEAAASAPRDHREWRTTSGRRCASCCFPRFFRRWASSWASGSAASSAPAR